MSTVSILLPTYEPDPRFLREAVASVLAQTYPHWTLLIHDDASATDIGDIIAPSLRDPRIRYERNAFRLGIGGNWNACLAQASGNFIAYLFQDDVWDPEYLARAVTVLEREPDVGIVTCFHAYRTDGSAEAEAFRQAAGFDAIQEARRSVMGTGTQEGTSFLKMWIGRGLRPNLVGEPSFVVLRKSVVDRIGRFREDLPQGLDMEYWLRILLVANLHVLTREAGFFRVHPSGASMRNDEAGAGLADRLRCIDLLTRHPDAPTDVKRAARQAFSSQLAIMFRKAWKRRGEGKALGKGNMHAMLPILLRHPILTLRALSPRNGE